MIELTEWVRTANLADKPWLVLGKGPTFSERGAFDLTEFNLMSLNHVVREMRVDVAHIIDVEVVEACAEALLENCDWVVMPRVPHISSRGSLCRLEEFFDVVPVLRELDERKRLIWYNKSTSPRVGRSPVVDARYFSAEAAFSILGIMGARTVRSLGVDGGRSYSTTFKALEGSTLLANGRPSFDSQLQRIEQIVERYAMDYRPLVDPIRIFVGCDESQLLAMRVLEYSIGKHTSKPVRVVPLMEYATPQPKHRRNRPRTVFSFSRFLIPSLCKYQGRAIYLDADMQVFGDIGELWDASFGEHALLCTAQEEPPDAWKGDSSFRPGPQMSVMLLDCERLDWDVEAIVRGLDVGRYTYEQLMYEMCIVDPSLIGTTLGPEWNHLEHVKEGETKLVHYTVVPTQPWKNDTNPLRDIWTQCYWEAWSAGAIDPAEVDMLIAKGHVKASLAPPAQTHEARPASSSLALELAAARNRIDDLETGPLRLWAARGARVARHLRRVVART